MEPSQRSHLESAFVVFSLLQVRANSKWVIFLYFAHPICVQVWIINEPLKLLNYE